MCVAHFGFSTEVQKRRAVAVAGRSERASSERVLGRLSLAERAIIKIDVAMAISGIAGY